MKNSFGRVIEIKIENKQTIVVISLALNLMNNPDTGEQPVRKIVYWNPKECKRRSNNWLKKKIDAIKSELTECLTG